MRECWHNPSSVHRPGQTARHAVELARESLARLLTVRPREITFTAGGTESIDLAIRGVLGARRPAAGSLPRLITSRVEHSAVRDLAEELSKTGAAEVVWTPLDGNGLVDPAALAPLISATTALVSIQWANNETGGIQPVDAIHALCKARGVPFHCDGVQWVGKEPVSSGEAGPRCDLLSVSAHKFGGLKGAGALWVRTGIKLRPTLVGTQELGRRAGTENVPGIMAMGAAADEAAAWLAEAELRHRAAAIRDALENAVLAASPGAVINGPTDPAKRLWNTTNIGFPRLEAEALLLALSERGVCASAGAACSSGSLEPSPVLLAMGIPPEVAHGSLRFSIGKETSETDVHDAARLIGACVSRLRASMP